MAKQRREITSNNVLPILKITSCKYVIQHQYRFEKETDFFVNKKYKFIYTLRWI